jgi:hypothetical protein
VFLDIRREDMGMEVDNHSPIISESPY